MYRFDFYPHICIEEWFEKLVAECRREQIDPVVRNWERDFYAGLTPKTAICNLKYRTRVSKEWQEKIAGNGGDNERL